ncbi:hypothetical protein YC2023_084034 [Brassica napus]
MKLSTTIPSPPLLSHYPCRSFPLSNSFTDIFEIPLLAPPLPHNLASQTHSTPSLQRRIHLRSAITSLPSLPSSAAATALRTPASSSRSSLTSPSPPSPSPPLVFSSSLETCTRS